MRKQRNNKSVRRARGSICRHLLAQTVGPWLSPDAAPPLCCTDDHHASPYRRSCGGACCRGLSLGVDRAIPRQRVAGDSKSWSRRRDLPARDGGWSAGAAGDGGRPGRRSQARGSRPRQAKGGTCPCRDGPPRHPHAPGRRCSARQAFALWLRTGPMSCSPPHAASAWFTNCSAA